MVGLGVILGILASGSPSQPTIVSMSFVSPSLVPAVGSMADLWHCVNPQAIGTSLSPAPQSGGHRGDNTLPTCLSLLWGLSGSRTKKRDVVFKSNLLSHSRPSVCLLLLFLISENMVF